MTDFGKTRKFNGEKFMFGGFATSKRIAEKEAEEFRKAGGKARVVIRITGGKTVYDLWCKPKIDNFLIKTKAVHFGQPNNSK